MRGRARLPLWQRWTALVLLASACCWPALLNGQAFFFPDTSTYIKGAATGVQKFLHRSSPWIEPAEPGASSTPAAPAAAAAAAPVNEFESSPEKKGVLAGRSAYYGGFLFAAYEAGGLWAPIGLQGLLAAIAIGLVVRFSQPGRAASPRKIAALGALLVLGTSLPMFVSMLMPDFLTGLAILLAAAAMAFPMSVGARAGCFAILGFATLSHSSNVLILGAMLAAFVVFGRGLQSPARPFLAAVALLVGALVVGLAGDAGFNAVVRRATGDAPIRPPFVMARLIADGPGTDWLDARCAQASYVVCRYRAAAGKGTSDEFLWNRDPAIGVFTVASKEERTALSAEQFAFAWDVLKAYPSRVVADAGRNFASQAIKVGLAEFNYEGGDLEHFAAKLPPKDARDLRGTLAAEHRFPALGLAVFQLLVLAVSAGTLVWWFLRGARSASPALRRFAIMLLLGLLANALVCGVLSTPHDRYQSRVMWLVPLLAFLLATAPPRRTAD